MRRMITCQACLVVAGVVAIACASARGDETERKRYEQHGQKGAWAKEVAEVLGTYTWSKPKSTDVLVTAWRRGCRDPLVGYVVLTRYRKEVRPKEANAVWQQLTAASAASYPGGLYRYGLCPFEMGILLLAEGKDAEAAKWLAQWHDEAKTAGADKGAAMVRHGQVFVMLNRSLDEAQAFWTKHAAELRSVQDELNHWTLVAMARTVAAERGPKAALAFLKSEPDSQMKATLVRHYQQQQSLVERSRREASKLPHKVLVGALGDVFPRGWHGVNWEGFYSLPAAPSGSLIECEVMRGRWFRRGRGVDEMGIGVPTADRAPSSMALTLGADGTVGIRGELPGVAYPSTPSRVVNLRKWRRLALDCRPSTLTVWLDGRCVGRALRNPLGSKSLVFRLRGRGVQALFRNVRVYVYSDTAVDNAAVKRALDTFRQGRYDGDLKAAQAGFDEYCRLLAQVPQAKASIEEHEGIMRDFKAMATEGGLSLCSEDFLGRATRRGNWTLKDGVLTGRIPAYTHMRHYSGCSLETEFDLPSFELTGIAACHSFDKSGGIGVTWNAEPGGASEGGFMEINPVDKEIRLGGPESESKRWFKVRNAPPTTFVFCLRARGDRAVLFCQDPTMPIARVTGVLRTSKSFLLRAGAIKRDARVEFSQLRLRVWPKEKRLDAPARNMPRVSEATTQRTDDSGG